jgi:hypothetical protein
MGGICWREDLGELSLDDMGLCFPMGGGSIMSELRRRRCVSVRPRLALRLLTLLCDLLCFDFFDREAFLERPRLGLPTWA